jgi:hypothetical protein
VSENKIVKRIFGPKRREVTGSWRRLHNEELHKLYASPYIISVINLRRIIWAGHVPLMGGTRNVYNTLENLKGRVHLEDIDVDRIILGN